MGLELFVHITWAVVRAFWVGALITIGLVVWLGYFFDVDGSFRGFLLGIGSGVLIEMRRRLGRWTPSFALDNVLPWVFWTFGLLLTAYGGLHTALLFV